MRTGNLLNGFISWPSNQGSFCSLHSSSFNGNPKKRVTSKKGDLNNDIAEHHLKTSHAIDWEGNPLLGLAKTSNNDKLPHHHIVGDRLVMLGKSNFTKKKQINRRLELALLKKKKKS